MRIATMNIFFFGTTDPTVITRTEADDALIARVIAGLDADILVFEEIFDVPRLAAVLDLASQAHGARRWTLRDATGGAASTGPKATSKYQVAMAWDASCLDMRSWRCLPRYPGASSFLRPPLLGSFRELATGRELSVIGLHLKSLSPTGVEPQDVRRRETEHLRSLLDAGDLGAPLAIAGDMNAVATSPVLAPLLELPGWTFPAHRWPEGVEAWTTWLDRVAIDHIGVGPGLVAKSEARVFAFDEDPNLGQGDRVGADFFHATDDFLVTPYKDAERAPNLNLYRVSDHRPVTVDLDWA